MCVYIHTCVCVCVCVCLIIEGRVQAGEEMHARTVFKRIPSVILLFESIKYSIPYSDCAY